MRGEGYQEDILQKQVFINQAEWEEIIAPFAEKGDERQVLAQAVARFESVVGSHAGTSHDKGGWVGNHYISDKNRPREHLQQNCNNDAQTVIQFLHRLSLYGLLAQHVLDPFDSVALYMGLHMAARLKTPAGERVVLDSWIGDNGAEPFVGNIRTREGIEAWQREMHKTRP